MRYEILKCDVPDCPAEHSAVLGKPHPNWGALAGIGWTDEAGTVITAEAQLCPEHKLAAAKALGLLKEE